MVNTIPATIPCFPAPLTSATSYSTTRQRIKAPTTSRMNASGSWAPAETMFEPSATEGTAESKTRYNARPASIPPTTWTAKYGRISPLLNFPPDANVTVMAGLTWQPEYLARYLISTARVTPGTAAANNNLCMASSPGTRKPTTIAAGPKNVMPKAPTSSERSFVLRLTGSVEPKRRSVVGAPRTLNLSSRPGSTAC